VVLDTNTIISGLLWSGAPRSVLQLIEQEEITPCISPALVAELRAVLERPKFDARLTAVAETPVAALNRYLQYADVIDVPAPLERVVGKDPDDDNIIACAVAASAEYIISGDRHLLDLGSYKGIPILNAADFLAAYAKSLTP
jgi:putative PIN family toxin of toxin-antitoxin system